MPADLGLFSLAIDRPPALMTYSVNVPSVTWSIAFSPDGRTALCGSLDGTLKLLDLATGRELQRFSGHKSGVISLAFSPDGRTAVSGSYDRAIKRWDIATGKELHTFTAQASNLIAHLLSPRTVKWPLCGGYVPILKLFDITTGTELRTSRSPDMLVVVWKASPYPPMAAAHSPAMRTVRYRFGTLPLARNYKFFPGILIWL